MELGIIGTSVWQQNMPLLESLTIDREQRPEILQNLKSKLGLSELVYVATCNRIEFIYATTEKKDANKILHSLIDQFFRGGKSISFYPNDFYSFTGKDAVTHLFRTAASLESLVLGENQITGQIKNAHQEAVEAGLSGPALDCLIREALNVSRKVKSQTSLGKGSVSMASLASMELCKALSSVSNPLIALVGSGPMQSKTARYIRDNLAADLLFVNRTVEKAVKLAEEFGGQSVSLDEFQNNPAPIDAIVSATAAVEPVFGCDFLGRLHQNNKAVVCVDLAVPRDFSTEFNNSGNITLIDIPLLKSKSEGSLRQKFVEAGKANEIVTEAVDTYLSSRIEVSLKPIFNDSYQESVELAQRALGDLFAKMNTQLPQQDQDAVVRLVTKLIGQSTFSPVKKLSRRMIEQKSVFDTEASHNMLRKAI